MNTTPTPCYCCDDPIKREFGKPRFVSRFEGALMDVCEDCASGIENGLGIFEKRGVIGEYLGPCGDNDTPTNETNQ